MTIWGIEPAVVIEKIVIGECSPSRIAWRTTTNQNHRYKILVTYGHPTSDRRSPSEFDYCSLLYLPSPMVWFVYRILSSLLTLPFSPLHPIRARFLPSPLYDWGHGILFNLRILTLGCRLSKNFSSKPSCAESKPSCAESFS